MDNSELIGEIDKWKNIFQNNNDNHLYELAFFKIFVKFEKFLADCFEGYCAGNESIYNYCPVRKLNFVDVNHLHRVLKCNGGGSFINHSKIIKDISNYFFDDNDDPFDIIKTDPNYSNLYIHMLLVRNVIAHESSEAKNKYHSTIIGNNNPYISPNEHLFSQKRGSSDSYYTIYTNAIKNISNYIVGNTNSITM